MEPSSDSQEAEQELEREVGEFITRNVLEKDTVRRIWSGFKATARRSHLELGCADIV